MSSCQCLGAACLVLLLGLVLVPSTGTGCGAPTARQAAEARLRSRQTQQRRRARGDLGNGPVGNPSHSLALAPMGIRPSTSTCTVREAHRKGKTGALPESLTWSLANSARYFSLLAGGHGTCIVVCALRRRSTESATPPLSPLECSINLRGRG